MISFRRIVSSASILVVLATLAGCSAESGTASGADTSDTARGQDTAAVDQPARPRGPQAGGPDFLLVAALHAPINLTAEQKTTIEGALSANKPVRPQFDKARASALAASIRAGKVDTSATAKALNEEGVAARQAASAKALATLHDTLSPEQRKSLVDAVTKRASEHGAKEGAGKEGAGKEGARGPRTAHRGGERGGPMGGMLKGLDLTKAQEDAIHAKLEAQRPAKPSDTDREAMKTQHEAFRTAMQAKLQSFANDSFDANAFVAPPEGMKMPAARANHFANDLSIITSVLEPAQREKLAARIEAGPQAPTARATHGSKVERRVKTQQ